MSSHRLSSFRAPILSLLLLLCSSLAWALPAGIRQTAEFAGFTEYMLDNGMMVVLYPDTDKPGIAVNIVYRVGSRHEATGEAGHAHLLEHMLFKGIPGVADVAAEFRARGIQWNATTSWDRTNYMAVLPADEGRLAWVIDLEARRMVSATFTPQELDTEMSVVRNEFERARSNPYQSLGDSLRSVVLPAHPYGRSPLGTLEQIERVDFARLRAFYKAHYRPDNAVLVMAGNFSPEAALEQVARCFGALPRPDSPVYHPQVVEPPQLGPRELTVQRTGGVELALIGYRTPAARHPDWHALQVLSLMLQRGGAGVLYRDLEQNRKLSEAAFVVAGFLDPALSMAIALPGHGLSLDAARASLIETLEVGLAARLVEDEMRTAQQALDVMLERAMEQPQSVAMMLTEPIAQGDWRLLFAQRDGYAAVTLADVHRVAGTYLRSDNRTVALYRPAPQVVGVSMPEPRPLSEQIAALKPRQAPSAGEALSGEPAELEARTTRLEPRPGWRVAVLRKKQKADVVQVHLVFRHSAPHDMGADFGWNLLGPWVFQGTATMNTDQFKTAMTALKAVGSLTVSPQHLAIRVDAPRAGLESALALMAELAMRPRLDPEDFQRLKAATLRSWDDGVNDPGARLGLMQARLINRVLGTRPGDFEHRWAGAEYKSRLERLTDGELRALVTTRWGASDVSVSAVGDVDASQLVATVARLFGGWGPGAAFVRPESRMVPVPGQRHHARVQDRPNAALSATLFLPMNLDDAERPALQMAHNLLSRGPDSVLWKKIRDELGASYDVSGSHHFPTHGDRATLSIAAGSPPHRLEEVLQAIGSELLRLKREGFEAAHLERARRDVLASRKKSRTEEARLMGLLDFQLDRRVDFLASQLEDDRIAALTLDQVNAAFRRHVDWSRFVVLTAGQVGEDQGLGLER